MKKLLCLVLAALMLAALCSSAFADSGIGVDPGQKMPDFTVTLTDGTTATLSELLKVKKLVVLNVFATWCGPCEREFPDMDKVYQDNSDKMVIVSVSGDPSDSVQMVADYKASHSLSFPMGVAGDALDFLNISAFPTTIFIDRDGKVGFIKIGAFVNEGDFKSKVKTFLSAGYDGKPLETEKAVNLMPFLFGGITFGTVLLTIGRWRLLRKAGKPGWHSLIPFLNSYKEYSLCWKGWIGVAADLCLLGAFSATSLHLGNFGYYGLLAANFVLIFLESFKLAKAFGKGKLVGLLLAIPALREIGRFILGVSKAKYQPLASRI